MKEKELQQLIGMERIEDSNEFNHQPSVESAVSEIDPTLELIKKVKFDIETCKKEIDDLKELRCSDNKIDSQRIENAEKMAREVPMGEIETRMVSLKERLADKMGKLRTILQQLQKIEEAIGENGSVESLADFKKNALHLKLLLKDGLALEPEISELRLEYAVLVGSYKERKLSELGLSEGENYWDLYRLKIKEKNKLEGFLNIGKLLKKKEIEELDDQIKELSRVYSLPVPEYRYKDYQGIENYNINSYIRSLEHLVLKLTKTDIKNIEMTLKEIGNKREFEPTPEQITRLEGVYMESFVLPRIKDNRNDLNDEEYEKVLFYIKKSLSIRKISYNNDSSESSKKTQELHSEVNNLDYPARSAIQRFWSERTAGENIQKNISIINQVGFRERRDELSSLINLFNKTVGHIGYLSIRNDLPYNHDRSFTDYLKMNTDMFKLIENDAEMQDLLGKENIQKTKDFIQKELIAKLFEIASPEDSRDQCLDFGINLIKLGDSKCALPILMNSFRELGYQSDYPLLKEGRFDSKYSLLGDYVKNLSSEDIENLKRLNIPGFSELISLFHDNPKAIDTFNAHDSYLTDEELGNKKNIHKNLGKILIHQVKTCDPTSLKFYLNLAESIDSALSEFYEVIKSVNDKDILKSVLVMTKNRLVTFKDLKCFDLLLHLQKKLDGDENIPKLIFNGIKDLDPGKFDSVRSIIEESANVGVLSSNSQDKIYSIRMLADLGIDINQYRDFIFKEIFKKGLQEFYYFHENQTEFFMDCLEKDMFSISLKQSLEICEIIQVKTLKNSRSDNSDMLKMVNLLYSKKYISEDYYKNVFHSIELSDKSSTAKLLEQNDVNEENWAVALSRYAMVDAGALYNLGEDQKESILALFSNDHPDHKELCLKNLQRDWREFLKTSKLNANSAFIGRVCKEADGIGDLKYIENISYMIYYLNNYISSSKSTKKTIDSVMRGLSNQEDRFIKEKWSEEDKSFFYSISKDILSTSPSLYTDFLEIFEELDPKDTKMFVRDYFGSYQAMLVVLDKGAGTYNSREVLALRKQIRVIADQIDGSQDSREIFDKDREKTISFLKDRFTSRFGIVKIPENFSQENIKVLESYIKYIANINNSDKNKEALLSFYMGISLNGEWQKFKQGGEIKVEDYLIGENLSIVQEMLSKRDPLEFVRSFDFGLKESDLPEFIKILGDETVSSTIGNIETVDVRLGNIKRAMSDLEDVDAYEHEEDKQILELYKKEGKLIGSTLSKIFSGTKGGVALNEKEEEIKSRLSLIYKIDKWTQNEVKRVQDETRGIGLISGILEKIEREGIDTKIDDLQKVLKPNDKVIAIFTSLDENFQYNSGATAVSEDLIYLENIIAKNQDKLSDEDKNELSLYLNNIRKQMNILEETTDHLKEYFEKLKKSIHGSNKVRLQERLGEIEKIIYSRNKSINIVSKMTGNLSDVVVNIRQCLGCLSPQCNNDTNLTFGEPYKFLMLSQNGLEKESIADQIVMCVPTTFEDGQKSMSFVLDTVYGIKSADVLFANINTLNKKIEAIKKKFKDVNISISVTNASLASVGLPVESFIQRYQKDHLESVLLAGGIKADIPKSKLGDNYAEYGGGTRPSGLVNIEGVLIR